MKLLTLIAVGVCIVRRATRTQSAESISKENQTPDARSTPPVLHAVA
jgi:hypothetical protein